MVHCIRPKCTHLFTHSERLHVKISILVCWLYQSYTVLYSCPATQLQHPQKAENLLFPSGKIFVHSIPVVPEWRSIFVLLIPI
jgi:hypothetical protein